MSLSPFYSALSIVISVTFIDANIESADFYFSRSPFVLQSNNLYPDISVICRGEQPVVRNAGGRGHCIIPLPLLPPHAA